MCIRFYGKILAAAFLLTLTGSTAGAIDWQPYTYQAGDDAVEAEIGHISVPENRSDPNSRNIQLAFVRFTSTAPKPGPPIVYLAGGPGGSGIDSGRGARFPVFMAMREFGDVIAFDQRGTGESEPDMIYRRIEGLPIEAPATREAMAALYAKHAKAMQEEMRERGIDLQGYTTNENADDIDDLRKALGAEKITLWGTSYGSHLAFAVLRRHGEHIERVILHGIEGPDHTDKLPSDVQQQLQNIAALVENDPAMKEKFPDFMAMVKTIVDRFRAEPVAINLSPNANTKREIVVGEFEVQSVIAQSIGGRSGIQSLPAALYKMHHEDYLNLGRAAFANRRFMGASAMALAMDTASGASDERQKRIARESGETLLGNAINFPFPEIREVIEVPDAGEAFRAPLQSDVPALFISGTIDGRTPVSNAEEILTGFPNGQHVIVENIGHGDDLFVASPKILEAMKDFMHGDAIQNKVIPRPFAFNPIEE